MGQNLPDFSQVKSLVELLKGNNAETELCDQIIVVVTCFEGGFTKEQVEIAIKELCTIKSASRATAAIKRKLLDYYVEAYL